MLVDTDFKYQINIPWKRGNTITDWNETCCWAMENYGLPGDRFITHAHADFMEFFFKDEADAIIFSLRWL